MFQITEMELNSIVSLVKCVFFWIGKEVPNWSNTENPMEPYERYRLRDIALNTEKNIDNIINRQIDKEKEKF